jgi:hypothetical protein
MKNNYLHIVEMSNTANFLTDDQKQAIHQIIAGAGGEFDYDTIASGLAQHGWIVHPVHWNGIIVGGILQRDSELHTSISPQFQKKWNPRPYIHQILYPALEKYGEVMSISEKEDARCLRWLQKLGFSIIREDDRYFYLQLTEIRYKSVAH